jgi:hypothetical protein
LLVTATTTVKFISFHDSARGLNVVRVRIDGTIVGTLEMTDREFVAFATFINPPQNDSTPSSHRAETEAGQTGSDSRDTGSPGAPS